MKFGCQAHLMRLDKIHSVSIEEASMWKDMERLTPCLTASEPHTPQKRKKRKRKKKLTGAAMEDASGYVPEQLPIGVALP